MVNLQQKKWKSVFWRKKPENFSKNDNVRIPKIVSLLSEWLYGGRIATYNYYRY